MQKIKSDKSTTGSIEYSNRFFLSYYGFYLISIHNEANDNAFTQRHKFSMVYLKTDGFNAMAYKNWCLVVVAVNSRMARPLRNN